MKKTLSNLSILLFVVLFAASTYAQTRNEASQKSNYQIVEANYLNGLNSESQGLRISSAYFLGEIKSEKAVIPLMEMFRNEKNDGAKLVIAWSLLKIGDARGVFLVGREAECGDCDGIRCMLFHMYQDYNLKTNGKIETGTVTANP